MQTGSYKSRPPFEKNDGKTTNQEYPIPVMLEIRAQLFKSSLA